MITQLKNLYSRLFKKKPFIRFYSIDPGVVELFPIIPSSQIKRKFASMTVSEGTPSPKSCPGIRKIVSVGWVVTAPADFIIKPTPDGYRFDWLEPWQFGTGAPTLRGTSYISDHGPDQTEVLLDDSNNMLKSIVKVQTPWRVETSDDIVLLQIPVTYANEHRFYSATGILDPKYAYNVNVQLFWRETKEEILVRAGTPLCQLIPISRKHLAYNAYDVKIEDATELDIKKEQAFVYAANCVIHAKDNISSRLERTTTILNKFSKKEQS